MGKEFVIYLEEHLIYTKAYGTWNERIYGEYEEAMDEAIQQMNQPFVEVLDLRKWKIGTLDMINMAVKRHKISIEAGRSQHITIAKRGAMNYLITNNHIYKRTGLYSEAHFLQFDEVESCCAYLDKTNYDTGAVKRFISELECMPFEDTDLFPSE
jgi:hypothetical protein